CSRDGGSYYYGLDSW
nr:immunoglobulin heavy chain junction region [Macaca mulatta]MPO14392.1 immunoglobulin heavy chain junction region [Macaca mulatta]MPO14419.1 immunoglobulin heavy chain junction region [Macaca mulatta]MPO14428.1 immunoglobulin heavy chain junction region [Macaca mulatta]MPO14450.1 immunoglobulin heavy chain junction region [Macaca mulatta]